MSNTRVEDAEHAIVKMVFRCGHTDEFVTPGVCDPAGILLGQPRTTDGIINTFDLIHDCYTCRENKERGLLKHNGIHHKGANAIETIPAEGA